jgi:hypothetical protein
MSKIKMLPQCWVLVAHSCNPRYSEGRDQKDSGLKAAWAKLQYCQKKNCPRHNKRTSKSRKIARNNLLAK